VSMSGCYVYVYARWGGARLQEVRPGEQRGEPTYTRSPVYAVSRAQTEAGGSRTALLRGAAPGYHHDQDQVD